MKVGTDFSGIGSPEQALKNLGIEHSVEFACEIDKYARETYLANHECKKMYDDITKRDHSEVPQLDLYVAGFPCQAFSIAGKRKGFEEARGTLFFNVAEFIKTNQPKTFILENVKGLLSHEKGRTFQTIISILSDNGGTVNGQQSIPYYDDGLGYHIHYKVLNTKEHGVPQNRERIFIIGFKDYKDYRFPIKEELRLKLKDILEDEVDEKYFLKKEIEFNLIKGSKKNNNELKQVAEISNKKYNDFSRRIYSFDGIARTLMGSGGNSFDKSGMYIAAVRGRYDFKGNITQMLEINESGTSNSLTSVQKDNLVIYNIPEIVRVRKHKVDIKELQKLLKSNKNISNQKIADELNVKKTTVEHWFRTDTSFSIPDANIWLQLKKLLNIINDDFDKSIMEFEEKEGVFEKANRCYDSKGIAPTLTATSSDERILNESRIRRLTPLECFRLQGYPDSFKKPCSDSQNYKMAGNSITVNVIQKIIENL